MTRVKMQLAGFACSATPLTLTGAPACAETLKACSEPTTGTKDGFGKVEHCARHYRRQCHSFRIGMNGLVTLFPGASTDIFGLGCPCQTLPVRTERYGAFLQASYKWDGLK